MRLKNNVTGAIIHRNVIETCGVWDYQFDQGGTNGEGIYIGTSSNQVILTCAYPLRYLISLADAFIDRISHISFKNSSMRQLIIDE